MLDPTDSKDFSGKKWLSNMSDLGIDTIVMLASSWIDTNNYRINFIWNDNSLFKKVTDAAFIDFGMDVYFGLEAGPNLSEVQRVIGDGKIPPFQSVSDVSLYTAENLEKWIKDNYGSEVWNNKVKGFYLGWEDGVGGSVDLYKSISQKVKQKYPNKETLISPWKRNNWSYDRLKKAFIDYYSVGIDIIAPQDGIGAGLTTDFEVNSTHFKALHDAVVNFPGKKAWANVETFRPVCLPPRCPGGVFEPTTIATLSKQISSSRPYVMKQITWIFQHNLSTIDDFYQMQSWSNQYTLDNAKKRQKLRADYIKIYNPSALYVDRYSLSGNNIRVGGNLGTVGKEVNLIVSYFDSQKKLQKIYTNTPVLQEDVQVTYIPLNKMPDFKELFIVSIPDWSSGRSSLEADLNNDGKVNIFDYNILVSNFGKTGTSGFISADINKDGKVDIFDYNILISNFGK